MKISNHVILEDKPYHKDSYFKAFEATIQRRQLANEKRAKRIQKMKALEMAGKTTQSEKKSRRNVVRKIKTRKLK